MHGDDWTSRITAGGDATFAGPLIVYDALAASATDSSFTIRNPGNTADVVVVDGNGAATFASTVIAAGKITANAATGLQSKYVTVARTGDTGESIDAPNNIIELYCQSDGGLTRGLKIGSVSATTGQWGNQWVYDATHPSGAHYFNIEEKMRFAVYKNKSSFYSGTAWDEVASIDDAGDATFSGSVKIGGTAAANEMDEYEEGTWTPSNAYLPITNNNTAVYTKVGRLVTVQFDCTFASSPADSSQSGGIIEGMPFQAQQNGFHFSPTFQNSSNVVQSNESKNFLSFVGGNSYELYFFSINNNCTATRGEMASHRVRGTVTYIAN
jgi:hypothetical protein